MKDTLNYSSFSIGSLVFGEDFNFELQENTENSILI